MRALRPPGLHRVRSDGDLVWCAPPLRRAVADHLTGPAGEGPGRRLVLAAMTRLLDRGFFRVGSRRHLRDDHTHGLSTLRRDQVEVAGSVVHVDYVAKEHRHRVTDVDDRDSAAVVAALLAVPGGPDQPLFQGDRWFHGCSAGGAPTTIMTDPGGPRRDSAEVPDRTEDGCHVAR